jgi:sec-independent protein translocase protein TatB
MFDLFAWQHIVIMLVVALVVVGPKDLPRLMRTFGHYAGKLRRAASDFQRQFEDAMRESEIDEVRKAIDSVRENTSSVDLKAPIDKPVMLPKPAQPPAPNPQSAGAAANDIEIKAEPSSRKKRAPSKPKTPRAKRSKKTAEPGE